MSDSTKQERIEEFLRKSLLGDEVINTQFHLFSAKALASGKVVKPRVLCANNALLSKSSKYFVDLLSSDINCSDHGSLIDIFGDNDIPQGARIDEYGYGSDSDLDVDEDFPAMEVDYEKDPSTITKTSSLHPQDASQTDNKPSNMPSPKAARSDKGSVTKEQENEPMPSTESAVEEARGETTPISHNSLRLRSLGSRHIFIKDTAFQTWYTLLNYLYTGKLNFSPLSSARIKLPSNPYSASAFDQPRCSAKSLYRLACKVGLDDLRDEAFAYIRSNLTEYNILQELSCSFVSKHPSVLEMELDVLSSHIASPSVREGFRSLTRRVANGELPHGADIFFGIHTRMLKTLSIAGPSLPRCSGSNQQSSVFSQSTENVVPSDPSTTQSSVPSVAAPVSPSLNTFSTKPAAFGAIRNSTRHHTSCAAETPSPPGTLKSTTSVFAAAATALSPSVTKPSAFSFTLGTPPPGPSVAKPSLFGFASATPPPGPSVATPSAFSFASATPSPGPSVAAPSAFGFASATSTPSAAEMLAAK